MKILYIDAFSGVSGDKMVGALLSLINDNNILINELKKLSIKDDFEVEIKNKIVNGINSVKFDVKDKNQHHHHRGISEIKKIINDSTISENAKKISIGIFEIL